MCNKCIKENEINILKEKLKIQYEIIKELKDQVGILYELLKTKKNKFWL
jgi:hypothetical protein